MGRVKTVPNLLTVLRILLLPFIVYFIVNGFFPWALFLFLLCAFTDFLDGYLARRGKSVTYVGILLDPIADKLVTSSVLISLAYVKMCDPYSVVALVGREEAVTGMRAIAASKGVIIPASFGGKLKTFLLMLSIVFFLTGFRRLGEGVLLISVAVAFYTAFFYFREFLTALRET
jgi:CDP-diacylglycerol--glycerol-3-phosphate 3-phosphatidyltransferase